MNGKFKLKSEFKPAGDQPRAISSLVKGLKDKEKYQTLLGVTGSGKTFTIANVINQIQKPTLVIAHNKTLAAQLASEYKEFFPENAVHYFVSYYDYYQPEAYLPHSDTYIEKEAQINEEIERLRHASTEALLTRKDVIIVASVSCIYGLGSPKEYEKVNLKIEKGQKISRNDLLRKFVDIHYERTNADLKPGQFRAVGSSAEIMPISERFLYRIEFKDDTIFYITKIDAISRTMLEDNLRVFFLFPAKHFITPQKDRERAIKSIKKELTEQLKTLQNQGLILEAERLKRRTNYDLAMIREIGYCNGIENYSRHFSGKQRGEAPDTLLSYFPKTKNGEPDFLTVIDESHVGVPQIRGMFAGDKSRKETLVKFGFRLPSAKDNRPLQFNEFEERIGQTIFTSATPGSFEFENSKNIVEQIIRPTGLLDPILEVRGVVATKNYAGQVKDFIKEVEKVIKNGGRVLATTLTKKMAEDLSEYLRAKGIKTRYLHSDIDTLERIEILSDFRRGEFDLLVGVNLLREGLDLPEVVLIGILDADKEGFLRSDMALIQTIGRAARNVLGRVILYADNMTGSLKRAIDETNRRRQKQIEYNKQNGITPQTIIKKIHDITEGIDRERQEAIDELLRLDKEVYGKNKRKIIREKTKQMNEAVKALDFETAAILRDEIKILNTKRKNK